MKSSSGKYFQGLDHIRALAAFAVFVWHFNHFGDGQLAAPLVFPLSFLTEGHTGVAIFMTLSGYLFAKLLDGKRLLFGPFLWNRFLRLAPLLILVIIVVALRRWFEGTLDMAYVKQIAKGILFPTLPNGGWSITVESHFYLVLPFLLYLSNRSKYLLLLALTLPVVARLAIYSVNGEVQSAAYWTIIGRIDQFILGILFFQIRGFFKAKGYLVACTSLLFLLVWYWFDLNGGFYTSPSYPSPSPVWVVLTLIEGLAYGVFIAWYDSTYSYSDTWLAKFVALIGTYSYSIYLLHYFIVFKMSIYVDKYLVELSNPYVRLLMAIPCFLALLPISYLSYRFVEEPCLRFRKQYLSSRSSASVQVSKGGLAATSASD